jgi:hypothetical protein
VSFNFFKNASESRTSHHTTCNFCLGYRIHPPIFFESRTILFDQSIQYILQNVIHSSPSSFNISRPIVCIASLNKQLVIRIVGHACLFPCRCSQICNTSHPRLCLSYFDVSSSSSLHIQLSIPNKIIISSNIASVLVFNLGILSSCLLLVSPDSEV